MWRIFTDVLQTASGIISIFVFLTGISSIPALFGGESSETLFGNAVLVGLEFPLQVALILLLTPAFGLVNSLLAISTGRLTLVFAEKMNIGHHDSVYWAILLLVLLPMIVGANLLFLFILFGGNRLTQATATGALSILTSVIFTFAWLTRTANQREK